MQSNIKNWSVICFWKGLSIHETCSLLNFCRLVVLTLGVGILLSTMQSSDIKHAGGDPDWDIVGNIHIWIMAVFLDPGLIRAGW